MELCFYGTYPSSYTVSRILEKAARDGGFSVVRCHEPFAESPLTSPELARRARMAAFLARYLVAAARLALRLVNCPARVLIAGFRGQPDVLLASLLRQTRRRKLVFAPLVTVSETLADRGVLTGRASGVDRLAAWLDRQSLHLADRVVIDTHAHADYLRRQFGVPETKLRVFHLGYDTEVFRASPPNVPGGVMRVLFYGSFLPLHGANVIVDAARHLRGERRIQFTICGQGWSSAEIARQVERASLTNVTWLPAVDYASIPRLIADHDVCLGIFAANQKAAMVIPNKVYQGAAVGRTVVTADTPAVREVFEHGRTIVLVPPDHPEALAQALLELERNPETRLALATNAARFMQQEFSARAQAERFASSFVSSLL